MTTHIFLDIDGVCNLGAGEMRAEQVAWLDILCRVSGASIVISSNWRTSHSIEELQALLAEKGLSPEVQVVGATPDLTTRPPGQLIFTAKSRWDEISAYLAAHMEAQNWVILDDGCDGFPPAERYVQTDFRHGLRDIDVVRALKILRQKPVSPPPK